MAFVTQHITLRLQQIFDAWVEHERKDIDVEAGIWFFIVSYMDAWLLREACPELRDARWDDIHPAIASFTRELLGQADSEYQEPVGGGVYQVASFIDCSAGPFILNEQNEARLQGRLDWGLLAYLWPEMITTYMHVLSQHIHGELFLPMKPEMRPGLAL